MKLFSIFWVTIGSYLFLLNALCLLSAGNSLWHHRVDHMETADASAGMCVFPISYKLFRYFRINAPAELIVHKTDDFDPNFAAFWS